jgi:hypothetical protein
MPGGAPPGGFNPAGFLVQERWQDMAPPPASMNIPPLSPAFEFGATVTAPLTAAVGVSVPGVQTLAPLGGNLGAALVAATQAPQAAPTGATAAAQPHSIVVDNLAPAADRIAAPSLGSFTRGVADPSRGAQASLHAVLATTSSHPDLASSSSGSDAGAPGRDGAAPLPRGADLIAEALPLAGDSLERSLEDFVRQLRAVDVAGIVTEGPTPIVVAAVAIAGAAASAVVVREVVRRRAGRGKGLRTVDSLGRELALSFPELPRSWSEKH